MTVPPALHIGLLGGFRVLHHGHASAHLPGARQQEILAFLVLHARGVPVGRRQVAGALWPDSTERQALTNLRRELHHLRDAWPDLHALLDAGSRTLRLRPDAGPLVDLTVFEAAAERGLRGDRTALQEAARLYRGDLLPTGGGEWIDAERERLHLQAVKVVNCLVDLLVREGRFGEAIEYATLSQRLEPLDEHAWRVLMRCHAKGGDRATALRLYQECTTLLKRELGVPPSAATRALHREILDLDAEAPLVVPPARRAVYPLVGRDTEWRALLAAWHTSASGHTHLVLIRGEAGIGKTRLAEELTDWCQSKDIPAATTRCYAGEGRLAYAPIASWLQSEALQPTLARLDPSRLSDVSRLHPDLAAVGFPQPPPVAALESWQRLRFFEALSQAFRSAAPLLLVLDDLQWVDADTVEWLQYFLRSASRTPCLIVATLRTEEEQDNLVLGRFLRALEREEALLTIALGPLDRAATDALAAEAAETPLDAPTLSRTFAETEGHPLFIVERSRMGSAGTGDAAPTRVQSVVAARLALLSDAARTVAEVAAAIGRDFGFDTLSDASDLPEEVLARALDELWQRHIIRVQADGWWDFSHDRIRDVAYAGLGPARRLVVHRRIAQSLETRSADRVDEVSASIAMHLERGGVPDRAIEFLERAAAVATRLSASEEAIRCLTRALVLIEKLPDGRGRDRRELEVRTRLSVSLNSARGYAAQEVEQNLNRVFMLLHALEPGEIPVRWIWAAFTLRFVLGDLKGTREFAELALARSATDPSCRCEAHHAMGGVLSNLGELDASRHHFELALEAYDVKRPQRSALGSDLGVFAHAWFAHTVWLLGDEESARSHADQAVALARRLEDVYSEALALAYAALLHQMRRDTPRVLECAEQVTALCTRHGFGYYGNWAEVLRGWALGQQRAADGIRIIECALERLDAERAQARRPYYLSLLAELYALAGNRGRAASILDAAIENARQRSDAWWLPALLHARSDLEKPPLRETLRREALEMAHEQHSRSLEMRIVASGRTLARTIRER